jgi:iron complex outermembrane receptor protein
MAARRRLLSIAALSATLGLALTARTAAADDVPGAALSAEDQATLADPANAEVIELWDERPAKPFDRDTEVRLTGEELARRGATDLATALALLPDLVVRDAGRGGWIVDIRGARKGSVRVLIDGVAVSDPYYGTFDVSTIPITDIEQIRISTAPGSPIDGPGAPGGVVEVHTRDAIGGRAVIARLTTSSLPAFGASATGRTPLADHLALRLSTTAMWGVRDFTVPGRGDIGEDRRATTGAARLEYRRGARRLAVDAFVDDRHYLPPPNEESANASVLVIDRETTGRVQATYDDTVGATQVQGRAWLHAMTRRSRYFTDAALTVQQSGEDLAAMRAGGLALVTRPFAHDWRWVASATVDHERADVDDMTTGPTLHSDGDVTLLEAAAGLQYERRSLRVDGAVGVAAPIGLGAEPWPEGKLVVRGRPVAALEVVATVARKGRTPSLRDRFDAQSGNPALGPEQATHGELRLIATPVERVQLDVAPYWRRTTGSMVADPASGHLVNLGELDVRGVDVAARVRVHPRVLAGGSYALTRDRARRTGDVAWSDDPLDLSPDHRAAGWLEATLPRRIVVTGRGRWYGATVDRTMAVDGYALVEASIAATFAGDWLTVLRCDDLLDAAPETRQGYHLPGRTLSLIAQGTWQ